MANVLKRIHAFISTHHSPFEEDHNSDLEAQGVEFREVRPEYTHLVLPKNTKVSGYDYKESRFEKRLTIEYTHTKVDGSTNRFHHNLICQLNPITNEIINKRAGLGGDEDTF